MMRAWGWESRLRELIESKRFEPFAWGPNDCFRFAIESYRALMQTDPPNVPEWHDKTSALRVIAEKPLEDWLTGCFGEPRHGFAQARRGDIVTTSGNVVPTDAPRDLQCAGVCIGPSIAYLAEASATFAGGVIFVPLDRGLWTWRIGD